MIEHYFEEDNVKVEEVVDNQTSLTFHVSCPDWDILKTITLSDLGIAGALGINTKEVDRETFLEMVKELFPKKRGFYMKPEWEFPLPAEWEDIAKTHVQSLKDMRTFNILTPSYFHSISLPLFAFCLLLHVKEVYFTDAAYSKEHMPAFIQELLINPEPLFTEQEEVSYD